MINKICIKVDEFTIMVLFLALSSKIFVDFRQVCISSRSILSRFGD